MTHRILRRRLGLAIGVSATLFFAASGLRAQSPEFIRGDVNNDVTVNLADAIAVLTDLPTWKPVVGGTDVLVMVEE